jgi:hypothetical protein
MEGPFSPSMVWSVPIIIVREAAEGFYDTSFDVSIQALLPAFPRDRPEKEDRENDDYDCYGDCAPEADDVVEDETDEYHWAGDPVREIGQTLPYVPAKR